MNNGIYSTNQDVSKSKYCLMYFSIILTIMIIIIVNFFETRNAFEENKIIEFRPNELCEHFIIELDLCKQLNKESDCLEKVVQMKQCFSDVLLISNFIIGEELQ